MDLFDLYARITLDPSDFEKGVKEADDGFGKLKSGISNVKAVVAGVSAAITAVTTLIAKAGIEAAAEVRAETSAFKQTFGDMEDVATAAIGRVADSSGILQERLNGLGSKIYAFAKASGGDATQSMSLMERALTVAADAAAYYDTSVENATETLQSFLKGNFENDAALGVSCTEVTRNAEAMELFGKKYQELTEIQKQQTLLSMVEDSQALTGAMGQAAREADGWENVIGNVKKAWQLLQAEMGEPVLDMVTPIIQDSTDALVFLRKNWDDVETAIERVAVALGSAGAALAAITAGQKAKSIATVFLANAEALAYFSAESGSAALAQEVLAGTFSVSEIAVGVLTGKISLATAAQHAWNTAMKANPIGLVVTAVGLLGVAIHNSISEVDALADSMVQQAATSEEAEKNLVKLQERFAEFEGNPNKWGEEKRQEYLAVKQAIEETETQIVELQRTEEEAFAAAAEAAADPVNVFNQATEQYVADATALYEKFVDTYEGIYDRVAGWFAPFEKVAIDVKANIEDMITAMESQIEFNKAYNENLQYLKEQGLGGLADAFQEYGAEGSAYAQAVAEALREAGGATTEEGAKIKEELLALSEAQVQSREELANTLTLANGKIEAEGQSMVDTFAEKIAELDKSKDALANAESTMAGFLSGINKGVPGILDAISSLGAKMTERLQASLGTVTMNVEAKVSGDNIPKAKTGMDYVPYDEYLVYLHKGEAVLTAEEAAAWRAGKSAGGGGESSGGGVTLIQNIETVPQTPVEFADTTVAYLEQARWTM